MARRQKKQLLDLDEVQKHFEAWRQTRHGKAPIPDELWLAAVEVARHNGVNRTAAALRLDGGKLMKRLRAADAGERPAAPTFVEFVAPRGSAAEYMIEVEAGCGKLRIHCRGRMLPKSPLSSSTAPRGGMTTLTFTALRPPHVMQLRRKVTNQPTAYPATPWTFAGPVENHSRLVLRSAGRTSGHVASIVVFLVGIAIHEKARLPRRGAPSA